VSYIFLVVVLILSQMYLWGKKRGKVETPETERKKEE
jgi:hypothetical protein